MTKDFVTINEQGTVIIDMSEGITDEKLAVMSDILTGSSRRKSDIIGRAEYNRFAERPGSIMHPDGVIEIPVTDAEDEEFERIAADTGSATFCKCEGCGRTLRRLGKGSNSSDELCDGCYFDSKGL